jgi:hypothetical protein
MPQTDRDFFKKKGAQSFGALRSGSSLSRRLQTCLRIPSEWSAAFDPETWPWDIPNFPTSQHAGHGEYQQTSSVGCAVETSQSMRWSFCGCSVSCFQYDYGLTLRGAG